MHWLAEGDPVRLRALSESPCIEFFLLLDKRIAESKKQIKKASIGK